MGTVTIPKTKYDDLKEKAKAYELLFRVFERQLFAPPPTRSVREILREFRKTGRYSAAFLKSLRKGLGRSSYFTK